MIGLERKEDNDLFFVCSLIEYIGRKTKNHRSVVVNAIGKDKLQHLYELADVYHSDNITDSKYSIPTHWDIGKVYKRLIVDICVKQGKEPIDTLIEVYNSWLSRKIEDFNSSLYYENPGYLYESYVAGDVL